MTCSLPLAIDSFLKTLPATVTQQEFFFKQMSLDALFASVFAGTGSFGRVMAVREKESGIYYALKILVIEDVIRLKQVEHVKNEKEILEQVNHPFVVNL